MELGRRSFLTTSGLTLVAGALAPRTLVAESVPPPRALDLSTWPKVRAQFDLAPEWLHFSQFFLVSHPRSVREAIERHRRQLDANPFTTVEHAMGFDGAHQETLPGLVAKAAAEYVGGRADEIALTDSTTMGLALVYNGLTLKAGDEILTTTHDHYVHHESIRLACERSGASSRRVALYDAPQAASADEMVSRLRSALGPLTRVVGLTWVHSSTGVKLPIPQLAAVVAEANRGRDARDRILVVLDAVHGFGNQDVELAALGCDFVCAGTHKWIFAPRGTGLIWAPARNWPLLRPTIPTFSAREPMSSWMDDHPPGPTQAAFVSPGGFKAYEHQWATAEAFDFHRQLGRKRVADRIALLNSMCKEGLSKIPKLTVLTPRDPALSAGIICFEIDGRSPHEIVEKLHARKVVASTSPYKLTRARLAPSLVNDEREVDAAVKAVRELA
jgi:isopenicillin-N epimerase